MKLSTESLARAASRRPGRTLGAWGGILAASVAAIVVFLPSALTGDSEVTDNPESARAYELMAERLPPEPNPVHELIVVGSDRLRVDDAPFRRKIDGLAADVRATGATSTVTTFYEGGDRSLVSRDRRTTIIPVGLGHDPEDGVERVIEVVERDEGGGFDTAITGEFSADRDFQTLSEEDLQKGELLFGLPAALIVVVLVFGAVVAGLVPVLLALVSIVVALALTALVGQAFELSFFVVNMLAGMGLALGIDYSLFIVSRYREERGRGREKLEAIAASGATASRAVVFSGIAFVLALTGMVLVPDTILRSLAVGAILVGVVSVVAALTLLPAVLSLLGDRVNALRIPWLGRSAERSAGLEGRFWGGIVRRVMRRPLISLVAAVTVLLAAASPVLDLKSGFAGISTLPERFTSRQGFDALERGFGVGTIDSVLVVVDGDVSSPPVRAGIRRLEERMGANPRFREAEAEISPGRRLAVVEALVLGDSRDKEAIAAVERLRGEDVPAAFRETDARVLVTGETAEAIDYFALVDRWLPIVFAFVLGLSFVLLTIAFRSIVVSAKAIALNLLSVGAAYGLLVLVFQRGVGNELLGFEQVDAIEAWVPLFLFSVLFGLSMDYHVFLLSRIRERFIETGDNSESVAYGVGSTARLITGAALIIIVVFAGFAAGDLVMFQQMGFGVAVSLLIDATLIRSVLVPAAMQLLGERNWYLPSWLGWLPRIEPESPEEIPPASRAASQAG